MKQKNQNIQGSNYSKLADKPVIDNTITNLKKNNIDAVYAENASVAIKLVFDLIPRGAEVMNMTSVTLDSLGISKDINESGNFDSVRSRLNTMDRNTQSDQMQKLGAAPKYVIGSVHAVTQDGKVVIASNTGSQLPAYSYGSNHVIWVVSTKKIVKDLDDAMKRIYEYTLPLESERAKKAYGVPGSFVSKLLIFNKEPKENRINLIFVNEDLGF